MIIRGEDDARLVFQRLGDCFDIYRSGDIRAAMADKYSNSLHVLLSLLLRILAQGAHDGLLGHFLIQ